MNFKLPKTALYLLAFVLLFSFFGQFIYTVSPFEFDKHTILLQPSLQHPFGTDRLGRDLCARIIEGGKISLMVGVLSALISTFIGLIVGIAAGYFRGALDKATVAFIDLLLTFPVFFLLLALTSYIEAGAVILIVIISAFGWMGTARLIRSEVFAINEKPFVKILKIAKRPDLRIMLKYYAPLLAPIFLVSFTFSVGAAVLTESGLSFLGLGITPPDVSWGQILSDGKDVMDIAWWVSFFPGLFIFAVTYALVDISNSLQEALNKKESLSA